MRSLQDGMKTHTPHKTFNTSETAGRKEGSWFQQHSVSAHNSVMKVGCVGRDGRLPCVMANIAMKDESPLNGTAPVNICIEIKRQSAKPPTYSGSPLAHLDHDHCKRKNVSSLL